MKKAPEKNETILVIGAGTIGLLTAAVAKTVSPESHVVCLARYPFQAEVAKKLGADEVLLDGKEIYRDVAGSTGGKHFKGYFGNEILLGGFDVIYDTVGSDRTVHNALRWTRGKGSVVLSGINFKPGKIDYSVIWNQEIHFTGINCHATEATGQTSFDMSLQFLTETPFPVEQIITHRFPMENYREAVQTFLSKKETHAIKIVLDHPTISEK
jgi:threonine dehydrogenase-like Zn-dependent dehydrogenase